MKAILNAQNYLTNYPIFMTGTFTKKVIVKLSSTKLNGTAPLYVQVFVNSERKQFPLGLYVKPKEFDRKKQRVRGSSEMAVAYNLIIEKELGKFTDIAVNFKLRNEHLTLSALISEISNGFSRLKFTSFYKTELERQYEKKIIKKSTYKQQLSSLRKIKMFKVEVYFNEITEDFVEEFKAFMSKELGNSQNTVFTAMKNFKKYLRVANKKKIHTPITYDLVKVKCIKGNRDFLEDFEIQHLYKLYKSEFVNKTYRKILKKFLFSCFTGLRISDVQSVTQQNFVGEYLVFNSVKGNKLNKIILSKSAKEFYNEEGSVFDDDFTEQCINDNLKQIAKICGIKKKITFHVARHTFATQYLLNGGKVEELKELLGHEKIETTMIYVHIVKRHLNMKVHNMDAILNI